jgi:hypothetical protein
MVILDAQDHAKESRFTTLTLLLSKVSTNLIQNPQLTTIGAMLAKPYKMMIVLSLKVAPTADGLGVNSLLLQALTPSADANQVLLS